jgi:hypothetical protein
MFVPSIRAMIPPSGVGVVSSIPKISKPREFSTQPWFETWITRTGWFGRTASMSSRVISRPSE